MNSDNHEPTRQELFESGKLKDRRSTRRPHILDHEEPETEQKQSPFLRPELIVITLVAIALLALSLLGAH